MSTPQCIFYHIIQIYKSQRACLCFFIQESAYKYTVLPVVLFLAPLTFIKCMDAALIPPHILNYLDDWLICAPTKEQAMSDTEVVLAHILKLAQH